ncbi:DUF1559 family PulG-like putative transporter [Tautonia rosea]|uniref:DUF1559 family PulG-like putative transporter n=1 Tax=Tautonia rosea TaxID=2728037 RepID=UPI001474412C|nr:DUF1559 domain-containing protein [Tautonia rosea]
MRRPGLTLIELMVVIGILGLLASLMLPAVQSARAEARRARCANNLKQLGLAMHAYQGAWDVFPPSPLGHHIGVPNLNGPTYVNLSAHVALLSVLEQEPIYDSINFNVPTMSLRMIERGANMTAASRHVTLFVCPEDGWASPDPFGPTNYRANRGVCGFCRSGFDDGCFTYQGTGVRGFTDGLTHTIAFSEKLVGVGSPGEPTYRPHRDWIQKGPAGYPLTISVDELVDFCARRNLVSDRDRIKHDAGRTWMLGGAEYTAFFASVPPNSPVPDCGTIYMGGVGVFAARSYHAGGVNVGMADGSVRFVSNGIRDEVWRALGTRGGGELIPHADWSGR